MNHFDSRFIKRISPRVSARFTSRSAGAVFTYLGSAFGFEPTEYN